MNQSHWLIFVFVATMVCNGNSRPRELEVTNLYPVYRSIKQLELENRYEKPFEPKQDDDSVAYLRIDIPYEHVNEFKTTERSRIKNNSKSVVDYVPVALTIKKTNVKKWPSDQNGIESQDDLSLYNTYTSNINPLNVVQSPSGSSISYIPHSKPSILILEELTSRPPFYEYSDSRPLVVHYPQTTTTETPQFSYLANRPLYGPVTTYPYYPPIGEPAFTTAAYPIERPSSQIPNQQTTLHHDYVFSTTQPETTTKKRKKTKCPNVSIIATSSVNNNNIINKEGCQDISIHIDTNLSNTNTGLVKPTKPATNTSIVPVQGDPPTQTGGMGFLEILWTIVTRIFSFSFSNPIFTAVLGPFSSLIAGGVSLSAMILPWFFPHLLLGRRNRYKKRFAKPGRRPIKYAYRPIDNDYHYLKRKTRDLALFYGSRRKKKKPEEKYKKYFQVYLPSLYSDVITL